MAEKAKHEAVLNGQTTAATADTDKRGFLQRANTAISESFTPQFKRDYRVTLHPIIRRFTGYREPNTKSFPVFPIPPLSWVRHLSPFVEALIWGWIGSFVSLLLIEAVAIKSDLLEGWGVPLIVGSFGASAVLTFATFEAPLAQPRNCIGGQVLSALTSVIITRLFRLNGAYDLANDARSNDFTHLAWLNAITSMATSLTVMQLTGTVHPPCVIFECIRRVQR